MRAIGAFLIACAVAGSVHAATITFRPIAKGERWPAVDVRREASDPPQALEARVTLRQATNPRQVFGPYLTAKEVGAFTVAAKRATLRQPLDPLLRVPGSSLVPGRYELRVRILTPDGALVGEGLAAIDEAQIEVLAGRPVNARPVPSRAAEAETEAAEPSPGDPKLAVLDARELAALPSKEARMTAQTFAYVLATRDGEAFRQLVAERGLRTDKGVVPHAELARQTARGVDPFLGPPPRAPWHVEFRREAPDRFTMKPSAKAAESVTFEKSADGRWRIGQVSRKRAAAEDE
jgi:hypothetical protein